MRGPKRSSTHKHGTHRRGVAHEEEGRGADDFGEDQKLGPAPQQAGSLGGAVLCLVFGLLVRGDGKWIQHTQHTQLERKRTNKCLCFNDRQVSKIYLGLVKREPL